VGRMRKRALLLTAGLALLASACGGGDDAGGEDHWIVGLLQRIPSAAPSTNEASIVDLSAAAAAAGITVPPAGAADDEIVAYLLGLPRDALIPDLLRDPAPRFADLTRELGIDPTQVGAAITAGTPPETYQVLQGDFDAGAIEAAVRADPMWSDLLTTAQYRDVAYYAWGADFASALDRVTPVRPLGWGGRLALDGRFIYWVPWTAGMEGLIDAGAGAATTLGEGPLFSRAARALEQAGVYSAILTDAPLLADAPVSGGVLAIGGGRDENGAFWVVAAVHDDAAAAEEAAAAFRSILTEGTTQGTRQPWSERVSSFEVTVEGDMLLAVMRSTGQEGDWVQAFYTREPLLAAAQG
jgi:hypothetical protein